MISLEWRDDEWDPTVIFGYMLYIQVLFRYN